MSDRPAAPDLRANSILRSLPERDFTLLAERIERVWIDVRHRVHGPNEPVEHLYFPLGAVFSLVVSVHRETGSGDSSGDSSGDGAEPDETGTVEVGTVGIEGFVGLPTFLGASSSPHDVFCQVPGWAGRLTPAELQRVLTGDGALHRQLSRYTQAMLVQSAQNIACNRMHTTEQRAARWLLMTQDRTGSPNFPLKQEFLAQMLGVRRPTVSLAAAGLQSAGLIRYSRGDITIADRAGLEKVSCSCYATLRAEFDRLLTS